MNTLVPRTAIRLARLAWVLGITLLGACENIETDVLIDAADIDDPCLDALFPWRPRMASMTLAEGDVALLKFESSEGPLTYDNSLAFTIADGHALAEEGSGVIAVAVSSAHARGQATMVLPRICPDQRSAFWVLEGELIFDRVVAERGEEISGSFDGIIVDGHDVDRVAATGVTMTFRFPFKTWRPFQAFSPMP